MKRLLKLSAAIMLIMTLLMPSLTVNAFAAKGLAARGELYPDVSKITYIGN